MPASAPAAAAETSKLLAFGVRKLSLVAEKGDLKNEFTPVSGAVEEAGGMSYDRTLNNGGEIILLNSRCGDGPCGDKVTFSLYALPKDLEPIVEDAADYVSAHPSAPDLKPRERAVIDQAMKIITATAFPHNANCDAIPMALSLPNQITLRLEADDAISRSIGTRMNEGFIYTTRAGNTGLGRSQVAVKPDVGDKTGHNDYPTA